MANERVGRSVFLGFRSPNYTQVPDELFDELLPVLSGAELKVLLYIVRRTFGFKRDRDSISLSQMRNGIRKRDGSVLDRGAGVSKPTLLQALRSLAERGIIATERRRSAEKGDEPTVYALHFAAEREERQKPIRPLVKNLDHGGGQAPLPPAWSRNVTSQERDGHQTDRDLSNFERSHDRTAESDRGEHPDVPAAAKASRAGDRPLGRGAGALVPLGEVLTLRASQAADAARRRRRAAGNAGHSEARERLRAFFQDASVRTRRRGAARLDDHPCAAYLHGRRRPASEVGRCALSSARPHAGEWCPDPQAWQRPIWLPTDQSSSIFLRLSRAARGPATRPC